MANKSTGLLGKKLGMTQIFDEKGDIVPVTVIDASGNGVSAVKSAAGPDGYTAVQLSKGERRESRVTKAVAGHFAKSSVPAGTFVKEVRLNDGDVSKYPVGATLAVADFFKTGDFVDVIGTSKGRGFAGVMKRHHFKGFIQTHGTHEYFRHGGSIGTRLTPGMTLKGKKMPGHMGAEQVTVQNLRVAKVDAEKGLVFVHGGVPGPDGGDVIVRKAVKKK